MEESTTDATNLMKALESQQEQMNFLAQELLDMTLRFWVLQKVFLV